MHWRGLCPNIREGIIKNKKIFKFKFDNYINIIFIEKKFENYEGIKVKIISIESKNNINNNLLNCSDINKIDDETRIDRWLKRRYSLLTQSFVENKLRRGLIRVNHKIVKSNYKVLARDVINISGYSEKIFSKMQRASMGKILSVRPM